MEMTEQFPPLPSSRAEPQDHPEPGLRRELRRAKQGIAVLVLGLGVAAALVPMAGAVVGTGHVGVASLIKRVTHPTGGVIAQIYVANGDHVRTGDPLIRFDDAVSGSESSLAALSVYQLLAQRARLEAERLGGQRVSFPDQLLRSTDPGARQAMADEARLFQLRQAEQVSLRAQLATRIVQYRRQIGGYNAQISAYRQQSVLIEPERRGVKELWDKGLVTISRKNELERSAVDLQGSMASLQASIAQTEARVTEVQEQIIQLAQTRRAEAGSQLASINAALNEQQSRNVAAADTQSRSLIRAAYPGLVDKLTFAAIGDVVRPAEPIMEIVPDNDQLVVEAIISPSDIDQIHKGQPARIRFTGLNSTATPEVPGKVIFIAADQTIDPKSQASYFAVRVQIDAKAVARGTGVTLKPGMPAEVFVETGHRSMLSYLTKPLQDQFARAFRDN